MSRLDYSKWNNIEVSDDEDDTHPNIDTPSLFRWRHQARVERMEQAKKEKESFDEEATTHKKRVKEIQKKLKEVELAGKTDEVRKLNKDLGELKKQEDHFKKKEEELAKKDRLTPWNVDTLCQPGFEKTIINKGKPNTDESEDEKTKKMMSFMDKHEKEIKKFGMIKDYNASRDYLRDNPHLVREDTASYLTLWCVNLEMQEKQALVEVVSHQTIVMQYILELGKQLNRDPRSCIPGFFERIKTAERQYVEAFEDEIRAFKSRVKARAKEKVEAAIKEADEEERKSRLGPGGLDPVEIIETLPAALKECFETKNVARLQGVLAAMPKEDAIYHMQRCIDAGLWVPDAKAAG
ncbi:Hsp90 co-chaperone Cdc37 [Geodia barretti]|nr:Hsp90 co-chaperone Cdc37 [Geodia barretti]